MSQILPATPEAIARAAAMLRAGRLVAFPTETVYGLGANALDDRAVAAIFAAKGRPRFNPLIVHVRDAAQARRYVAWNGLAEKLAQKFWPGALTLVLPRLKDSPLSLLVSAGLDSAAIRCPAHKVAQKLLAEADLPLAAPSANRSGAISPTRAEHVAQSLGQRVELILDDGPCAIGVESTVLDLTVDPPALLRPGAIDSDAIAALSGRLAKPSGAPTGGLKSPGMLESHYAPNVSIRLNATSVAPDEALLGFGADIPQGARATLNLSPGGDLAEAAANFFAMLRALDASGASAIAVMAIPRHGLGEAINDRLQRAAAPHA